MMALPPYHPPRAFTVDTTSVLWHATPTLTTGTFLPSFFSTQQFHARTQQHRLHRFYLDTNVFTTEELQLHKLPKPRTRVFLVFCVLLTDPSLCSRALSAACGSNPCGGHLHLQSQCCIGFTFFNLFCLVCFALVPTRGPRRLAI